MKILRRFLCLLEPPMSEKEPKTPETPQTTKHDSSVKRVEPLPDDLEVVLGQLNYFARGDAIKYLALDSAQRGDIHSAENYLGQYEADPELAQLKWQTAQSEIEIAIATYLFDHGNKERAEILVNRVAKKSEEHKGYFNHEKTLLVRYYRSIGDFERAGTTTASMYGYTALPEVKKLAQHHLETNNLVRAKECAELLNDNRWRVHLLVDIARHLKDRAKVLEVLKEAETLIPQVKGVIYQSEVQHAVAEAYAFAGTLQEAEHLLGESADRAKPYLQVEYAKSLVGTPEAARKILAKIDLAREWDSTRPAILIGMAEAEILLGDNEKASAYLRRAVDAAASIDTRYEEQGYQQAQYFTDIAKMFTDVQNKEGFEYLLSKPEPITGSTHGKIRVEYIRFLLSRSHEPTE